MCLSVLLLSLVCLYLFFIFAVKHIFVHSQFDTDSFSRSKGSSERLSHGAVRGDEPGLAGEVFFSVLYAM